MGPLSQLGRSFMVLGIKSPFLGNRTATHSTMWIGRFISTRSMDCSEKCAKFNPNKTCCRESSGDDGDDGDDFLINPLFSGNPLNIWHAHEKTRGVSSFSKHSSELQDSSLNEINFATDFDDLGSDFGDGD
jgi:hypothetical protein